jgi:hypothetical protein
MVARVLCAILLAVAALTLASCGKTYARGDFQKLVINKTTAQVEAAVGKPDWEDNFDPKIWTYRATTFDPANNGKKDEKALLFFGKAGTPDTDKVVEVRFE